MDKVYIVERSSGQHDYFTWWVDKIFIDENKAKYYVEKNNLKIERIKKLSLETMLKNEYGELSYEDPNWTRHDNISDLNKFYLKEFEITK